MNGHVAISTPSPSPEPQGKHPLYAASCATKRANLLKYSAFTGGGRAEKHEGSLYVETLGTRNNKCQNTTSAAQGFGLAWRFFVSALLTVVLVMLLCSCTKEGAEAAIGNKIQFPDSTSTVLHIVGADTIYPGLSLDTAWLDDTVINFNPLEP